MADQQQNKTHKQTALLHEAVVTTAVSRESNTEVQLKS